MKPHRNIGKHKTNAFVLSMPTNARDQGQKELDTNLIKITLLQKGTNSITHESLGAQIHSDASKHQKIPDAKAAVEKE